MDEARHNVDLGDTSDGLSAEVEEKLLWSSKQDELPTKPITPFPWGRQSLVFHAVSLLFFVGLYAAVLPLMGEPPLLGANLVQSPAASAVSYTKHEFNHELEVTSPFFAPASPKVDEAWADILKYSLSAVKPSPTTGSLKSLQGSQGESVVMLDVFRSLSCMNTIRRHLARGYYGAEAPAERQLNECIDQVRQAIACHLDIALGSYRWKEGAAKPWPNFVIERECKNWDAIQSWAKENRAPDAMKTLVSDY